MNSDAWLRKIVSRKPHNLYWDIVTLDCGHTALISGAAEEWNCDRCRLEDRTNQQAEEGPPPRK